MKKGLKVLSRLELSKTTGGTGTGPYSHSVSNMEAAGKTQLEETVEEEVNTDGTVGSTGAAGRG